MRWLVVDGNILTRSGACAIQDALQRENADAIYISIRDCGVSSKLSQEFDPSEPGGTFTLNLASEYDTRILYNLVNIATEGLGNFERGSMKVDGKPVSFSAPELQKHFEAWISESADGALSSHTLLPEKGSISFRFPPLLFS